MTSRNVTVPQVQARCPHLRVFVPEGGVSRDLENQLRLLHTGDFDACIVAAADLPRWSLADCELLSRHGQLLYREQSKCCYIRGTKLVEIGGRPGNSVPGSS